MNRKLLALILALTVLLTLAGCSQTTEVEDAIDAIGTVTMESKEAIEYAEDLYNALPAAQQGKVSNAVELVAARKEYDRLAAAVQNAIDKIDAIGTVTLDSEPAILEAREAYDALRADGLTKYAASHFPTLARAQEAYDELCAQEIYKNAEALDKENFDDDALKLYDEIILTYPDTETAAASKPKAAEILVAKAQVEFKAGNLELCKQYLDYCAENYIITDAHKTLSESLYLKLSQIRPATGRTFARRTGNGYSTITVKAGDYDAYIKLENIQNPAVYTAFYVRAGEEYTFYMGDGEYILKYATGEYWYDEDTFFGENTVYTRADETIEFTTTTSGNTVTYTTVTFTLYSVAGGNAPTSAVDADNF